MAPRRAPEQSPRTSPPGQQHPGSAVESKTRRTVKASSATATTTSINVKIQLFDFDRIYCEATVAVKVTCSD